MVLLLHASRRRQRPIRQWVLNLPEPNKSQAFFSHFARNAASSTEFFRMSVSDVVDIRGRGLLVGRGQGARGFDKILGKLPGQIHPSRPRDDGRNHPRHSPPHILFHGLGPRVPDKLHCLDVLRRHARGLHLRHGWDGSPDEVQPMYRQDAFLTAAYVFGNAFEPEGVPDPLPDTEPADLTMNACCLCLCDYGQDFIAEFVGTAG